jgi:hypothetical protein
LTYNMRRTFGTAGSVFFIATENRTGTSNDPKIGKHSCILKVSISQTLETFFPYIGCDAG